MTTRTRKRWLVAPVAGLATVTLLTGCGLLLAYVVALTYVARFEGGGSPIRRWWPLVGLSAPILFVLPSLGRSPILPILSAAFALWVLRAVNFARAHARRRLFHALFYVVTITHSLKGSTCVVEDRSERKDGPPAHRGATARSACLCRRRRSRR